MKFKNKTERKAALIASARRIGLVAVIPFLSHASKGEVRQSVRETIAPIAPEMNDSIEDEDGGFKSGLSFDEIKEAKQKETDVLLSADEKAQLARDLAAHRARGNTPPAHSELIHS